MSGSKKSRSPRAPEEPGASSYNFQERRKKADWIAKATTIMSLLAWVAALAVWVFLDMASPDKENMFTRAFGINVRGYWDVSLLPSAFILLIGSLVLCLIAFFFNKLRMRRKTDKYRKSVFIIGGITIIGIVAFLVRFGSMFLW